MKLNSKRDKRNYIIIALCMILVVMGVGYAAFSSMLTINGTANISNSWCLGFDNSKTNAYEITKGVSTGEAPTGTMTYSGDVCSTNLVPHSNLTAVFHQPGDQIEYTLTIKNASTVTAAIKSIKVDNQNITGNTTKTKGNITFTINFPAKTTLTSNETTTMTIIAKFQNETDVTGSFAGSESQTISVELNGEQDDGNGGIVPTPSTFTGTIYRNNTNKVAIGDSIATVSVTRWCAVNENTEYNSCDDENWGYYNESDCLSEIDGSQITSCQQGTVTTGGAGDYTTNASSLNKTYYLKHDVVKDIVTASYVCFITDTEHCMQGGDSSYYEANETLLQGQEEWFNNNGGSCSESTSSTPISNFNNTNYKLVPLLNFKSSSYYCTYSALETSANKLGDLKAGISSSGYCNVYSYGNSYCGVSTL